MIVELPIEFTLRCVAETRKGMVTALQSREALEIDATKVAEVDVAGLQLLCSLHRGAVRLGMRVVFCGGYRGAIIQETQSKAGFARHVGCAPECLWLEPSRG